MEDWPIPNVKPPLGRPKPGFKKWEWLGIFCSHFTSSLPFDLFCPLNLFHSSFLISQIQFCIFDLLKTIPMMDYQSISYSFIYIFEQRDLNRHQNSNRKTLNPQILH
jgi:hypothetical protein